MKPKIIIGVLFAITFVISFAIYLVVATFIAPHLDLSSSAKKDLEIAPELKGVDMPMGAYQRLHNANIPTENDSDSGNNNSKAGNDQTKKPDNNIDKAGNDVNDDNQTNDVTSDTTGQNTSQADPTPPPPPVKPMNPAYSGGNQQNNNNSAPSTDQVNKDNLEKPLLDRTLNNNIRKSTPVSINKVIIGSYGTPEEAKKASENLSSMNINPVIKHVNGRYSIQAGAFSDKKKAENLANKLHTNNYKASVYSE